MKTASTLVLFWTLFSTLSPTLAGPRGVVRESSSHIIRSRQLKEKKEPKSRNCEIAQEPDKVEFACKTKTNEDDTEIRDQIQYSVTQNSGQGVRVKVKYQHEESTNDAESGLAAMPGDLNEPKPGSDETIKVPKNPGDQPDGPGAKGEEVEEKEPTAEDAPATEGEPAAEGDEPAAASDPVAASEPVAESEPASESVPSSESVPAAESVPVAESVPATASVSAAESVPAADNEPASEEEPAAGEESGETPKSQEAIPEGGAVQEQQGTTRNLQKNTTETETEFEVIFSRILEYAKSKNSSLAAYEYDVDEVVQQIDLTDLGEFSDVQDDGNVMKFSVSTTDGTATFQFSIHRNTEEGSPASANNVKIDVRLTNFPWQRDNTNIALISSIESKRTVHVKNKGGPEGGPAGVPPKKEEAGGPAKKEGKGPRELPDKVVVELEKEKSTGSGYVPFGAYTWAKTAEATSSVNNSVNGTAGTVSSVVDVVASSIPSDDGKAQIIAFSFVGEGSNLAQEIFWDPEAGIGYSESSGTTRSFFVSSFGLVIGVIATIIHFF